MSQGLKQAGAAVETNGIDVEGLTWRLLDCAIDANGLVHLHRALVASAEARRAYANCIRIHVDLMEVVPDSGTVVRR
ncbi:MAG: hypothetical protein WBF93_15485 [Pirellulales bacterium]